MPLGENETRGRFETGQNKSQKSCLTFDSLNRAVGVLYDNTRYGFCITKEGRRLSPPPIWLVMLIGCSDKPYAPKHSLEVRECIAPETRRGL